MLLNWSCFKRRKDFDPELWQSKSLRLSHASHALYLPVTKGQREIWISNFSICLLYHVIGHRLAWGITQIAERKLNSDCQILVQCRADSESEARPRMGRKQQSWKASEKGKVAVQFKWMFTSHSQWSADIGSQSWRDNVRPKWSQWITETGKVIHKTLLCHSWPLVTPVPLVFIFLWKKQAASTVRIYSDFFHSAFAISIFWLLNTPPSFLFTPWSYFGLLWGAWSPKLRQIYEWKGMGTLNSLMIIFLYCL